MRCPAKQSRGPLSPLLRAFSAGDNDHAECLNWEKRQSSCSSFFDVEVPRIIQTTARASVIHRFSCVQLCKSLRLHRLTRMSKYSISSFVRHVAKLSSLSSACLLCHQRKPRASLYSSLPSAKVCASLYSDCFYQVMKKWVCLMCRV
jgi:hypothetical protein